MPLVNIVVLLIICQDPLTSNIFPFYLLLCSIRISYLHFHYLSFYHIDDHMGNSYAKVVESLVFRGSWQVEMAKVGFIIVESGIYLFLHVDL